MALFAYFICTSRVSTAHIMFCVFMILGSFLTPGTLGMFLTAPILPQWLLFRIGLLSKFQLCTYFKHTVKCKHDSEWSSGNTSSLCRSYLVFQTFSWHRCKPTDTDLCEILN